MEILNRPGFLKQEDGVLLNCMEAEYMVESLCRMPIEQVGSRQWMKQHENLGKLNLQAHYNTMAHCDEFVVAALISHDKMEVLVHELLVIEIWMENICPQVLQSLTAEASTITLSLILHQETTIVNLLEVILFHREACEALGSDALLELADYVYRKTVYLNTKAWEDAIFKERTAMQMVDMKPQEEFEEKVTRNRFRGSICALSVLRYLTDYIGELPLSILARLVDCHDILMALTPLVDSAPWKRKRKSTTKTWVEMYAKGKWTEVPVNDRFKMVEPDVQLWLAINNLLLDPKCRAKYVFNDFRRSQVLKLGKHLNDMYLDQLPVLRDLKWALEELQLKIVPTNQSDITAGYLILEQVPMLRESILCSNDWGVLAKRQAVIILGRDGTSEIQMQEQAREMMKMFEFGEMMQAPNCAACGAPAVQRCSRCKIEWYCGRPCQVKVWQQHKQACNLLSQT
ncbi:unnamed protein product [Calypogeia fissa]